MQSNCVGMEGAPHEGVAERFSETNTMKKILAALVAFAALTAAAPALGADLGGRPYYKQAPVYAPVPLTGPASISAAISAAPSAAATTSTARC